MHSPFLTLPFFNNLLLWEIITLIVYRFLFFRKSTCHRRILNVLVFQVLKNLWLCSCIKSYGSPEKNTKCCCYFCNVLDFAVAAVLHEVDLSDAGGVEGGVWGSPCWRILSSHIIRASQQFKFLSWMTATWATATAVESWKLKGWVELQFDQESYLDRSRPLPKKPSKKIKQRVWEAEKERREAGSRMNSEKRSILLSASINWCRNITNHFAILTIGF